MTFLVVPQIVIVACLAPYIVHLVTPFFGGTPKHTTLKDSGVVLYVGWWEEFLVGSTGISGLSETEATA